MKPTQFWGTLMSMLDLMTLLPFKIGDEVFDLK